MFGAVESKIELVNRYTKRKY